MSKTKELDFSFGRIIGGFTFYPYQLAFGVSVRYWPCIFMPSIRIHVGPFKFWCGYALKKMKA